MPSYYCPELNQSKPIMGTRISLAGSEAHHLIKVLHARAGDYIKLNSGSGIFAAAVITTLDKHIVEAELTSFESVKRSLPEYAIAFSLLKNKHDELLLEKCTELGASAFFPFTGVNSVRKGSENAIDRFEKIALAAIKQCDNPWLPKVSQALPLKKALEKAIAEGFQPIICSELRPQVWLHHLSFEEIGRPCFVIGPEGGFSIEEYRMFSGSAYQEISLGHLITRAETAAIAIAAQFNAYANQGKTIGTT
ncbi:MAG: RsmE family RNA methyltransferase [Candidatus Cloacimonadaceae bacterium]|nr:RsmE family RNA methyltransferase [Candidatus Cloacimonadaceae bacterium]